VPSNPAPVANGFAPWNASPGRSNSGGLKSTTTNPRAIARRAAGIFFPQRLGLHHTPHGYSPSVIGKIVRSGARHPSFQEAAETLKDPADVAINSRQVIRIAHEVDRQLVAERDHQVEQFQAHQLAPQGATQPALAVVQVDGGRLQLRGEGEGPGAHDAAWREDKVSMLATAAVQTFTSDPESDLPEGFRDRKYVEALVRGMGGVGPLSDSDPPAEDPPSAGPTAAEQDGQSRAHHAPELWVRTYVASTCAGDAFGPMVAAEAERRHFRAATHRVFVGDGAAWIWKLQRQFLVRR
jgi:hypothetical protein